MLKRIFAAVLAAALVFAGAPRARAAAFRDVPAARWYFPYVELCADRGFMGGRGDGTFAPDDAVTVSEARALAARLAGESAAPDPDPDPVTRAAFAALIYEALADTPLPERNAVSAICDVPDGESWSDAVLALYRAGILTGADAYGAFRPYDAVTRAQACAAIARALEPDLRARFLMPEAIPAADIFSRGAAAAFTVETFDAHGRFIRSGSGFFISGDGLAVTNLHVLSGAYTAVVRTGGGAERRVLGARAHSEEANLAVLQVEGGGYACLALADSSKVRAGADAYALGSPLGLSGSLTRGVIAFTDRETGGRAMLQFTPAISQGSGGGALLDALGRVVGVTASSYTYGTQLNFAVPSNDIRALPLGGVTPLDRI